MIDPSRQLPAAPKRVERRLLRELHADNIKRVFERVGVLPADYLVCHQESDPDRVHRIRAEAKQRIAKRNAKRQAANTPAKPRIVIFTPTSGVVF